MTDQSLADFRENIDQIIADVNELRDYLNGVLDQSSSLDSGRVRQSVSALQTHLTQTRRSGIELAQRANQIDILMHTTQLINSSLEPQDVIDGLMDAIIQLTGAERAYIVLVEGSVLKPYAARNWDSEAIPNAEVSFSRSIIRAALEQGKPVVTTNAQADERFERVESIEFKMVRAVMCVPIMLRDETIGVVYADNRLAPGIFNTNMLQLVQTFTNQAALAIENARRFQQVKQDLEAAQKELQSMRIRIDEGQRESALKDITETEYFRRLQDMVRDQRSRHKKDDEETE